MFVQVQKPIHPGPRFAQLFCKRSREHLAFAHCSVERQLSGHALRKLHCRPAPRNRWIRNRPAARNIPTQGRDEAVLRFNQRFQLVFSLGKRFQHIGKRNQYRPVALAGKRDGIRGVHGVLHFSNQGRILALLLKVTWRKAKMANHGCKQFSPLFFTTVNRLP